MLRREYSNIRTNKLCMLLHRDALIHLFLFMYKNSKKENNHLLMVSYVAVKIHF